MTRRFYPDSKDALERPYEQLRWSRFVPADPGRRRLHLRASHEGRSVRHPNAGAAHQVVDLLADVPMEDRDTKGELCEYKVGKIASAGQNGQFRTPRHIISLMVEMTAPRPTDTICVGAGER